MMLAAGFGLDGVAIMGVGLYTFGLVCLKGFEGESLPVRDADDSMVVPAILSDVEREWVGSLKGFDGPGDLLNLGFVESAGTCGAVTGPETARGVELAGRRGGCSCVSGDEAVRRDAVGAGATEGGGGTLLLGADAEAADGIATGRVCFVDVDGGLD